MAVADDLPPFLYSVPKPVYGTTIERERIDASPRSAYGPRSRRMPANRPGPKTKPGLARKIHKPAGRGSGGRTHSV
jgi:hypothetical protein